MTVADVRSGDNEPHRTTSDLLTETKLGVGVAALWRRIVRRVRRRQPTHLEVVMHILRDAP